MIIQDFYIYTKKMIEIDIKFLKQLLLIIDTLLQIVNNRYNGNKAEDLIAISKTRRQLKSIINEAEYDYSKRLLEEKYGSKTR